MVSAFPSILFYYKLLQKSNCSLKNTGVCRYQHHQKPAHKQSKRNQENNSEGSAIKRRNDKINISDETEILSSLLYFSKTSIYVIGQLIQIHLTKSYLLNSDVTTNDTTTISSRLICLILTFKYVKQIFKNHYNNIWSMKYEVKCDCKLGQQWFLLIF